MKFYLNSLPDERLTELHFDSTMKLELKWIEEDEFIYNGKIYDIVHRCFESDKNSVYLVIWDSKEESLMNDLKESVKINLGEEGQASMKFIQAIKQMHCILESNNLDVNKVLSLHENCNKKYYLKYYTKVFFEIPSPPPESIFVNMHYTSLADWVII